MKTEQKTRDENKTKIKAKKAIVRKSTITGYPPNYCICDSRRVHPDCAICVGFSHDTVGMSQAHDCRKVFDYREGYY